MSEPTLEEQNEAIRLRVVTLAKKASEAEDAGEAMRFSQAAINAAQALAVLSSIQPGSNEPAPTLSQLKTAFYEAQKDFAKEQRLKQTELAKTIARLNREAEDGESAGGPGTAGDNGGVSEGG